MNITTETQTKYKFELKLPSGADYSIARFAGSEKKAAEIIISEFQYCIDELKKVIDSKQY